MNRKPIKLRNAVTELWNNGAPMSEMTLVLGMSEQEVKEYLACAKRGYHTPSQEKEAAR